MHCEKSKVNLTKLWSPQFFFCNSRGKMENYSKATIQTLMQRKMSVELRVTSKGEGNIIRY